MPRDEQSIRVSLAIRPTDEMASSARPIGPLAVLIKEYPSRRPVMNPSGYAVFTNLPAGTLTVMIVSKLYQPEQQTVTLPLAPPAGPVVTVPLTPRWFYPFPSGTTLVTGKVTDSAQPVADAVVKLMDGVETKTDQNQEDIEPGQEDKFKGKFVLMVKGLTEDRILIRDSKRFIKAKAQDRESLFQLSVTCSGYREKAVTLRDLEEGKPVHLASPIVLTRL